MTFDKNSLPKLTLIILVILGFIILIMIFFLCMFRYSRKQIKKHLLKNAIKKKN